MLYMKGYYNITDNTEIYLLKIKKITSYFLFSCITTSMQGLGPVDYLFIRVYFLYQLSAEWR